MTVKEFYDSYTKNAIIKVRSGYNDKLLCRQYIPHKHFNISSRKVISVHVELDLQDHGTTCKAVLVLVVDGHKEYEQEAYSKNY